jgi:phospholipid transport system transporter-binding protein
MSRPQLPADGCRLESLGEGRYSVAGELGLASAAAMLAAGRDAFTGQPRVDVDLSRVERADSAGLAVLIEWARLARLAGMQITFHALPARLSALARIGGVDQLLPIGG